MDKSRKKSAVLFACIFVVLGMWMMLSVHCQAAETNNDEKQPQTIRVGSFEDTFNYVDKNGVRREDPLPHMLPRQLSGNMLQNQCPHFHSAR